VIFRVSFNAQVIRIRRRFLSAPTLVEEIGVSVDSHPGTAWWAPASLPRPGPNPPSWISQLVSSGMQQRKNLITGHVRYLLFCGVRFNSWGLK
jgi:hypothetical protein